MSKLDVTIQTTAPNVDAITNIAQIKISMGVFTASGAVLNASDLISNDVDNHITTGTDGKLLVASVPTKTFYAQADW